MKPEYTAIAASGLHLQLDCPDLAMSRHTGYQDLSEERFVKIAAANVEALNAATAVTARPATILFEAANSRHEHEWKVWAEAKIPQDKILAQGLIDTRSNYVEHPELIAQRIERFAAIVGIERVIASTDSWKKLRSLREGADIAAATAVKPDPERHVSM